MSNFNIFHDTVAITKWNTCEKQGILLQIIDMHAAFSNTSLHPLDFIKGDSACSSDFIVQLAAITGESMNLGYLASFKLHKLQSSNLIDNSNTRSNEMYYW